jgi:hypothetical protein
MVTVGKATLDGDGIEDQSSWVFVFVAANIHFNREILSRAVRLIACISFVVA